MEAQRGVLVVFLILFFLFSPDTSQPSRNQRSQVNNQIQKEKSDLANLRNASYGRLPSSYYGKNNATEPEHQHWLSWDLLPEVQRRARTQYLEFFLGADNVSKDEIVAGSEHAYEIASRSSLPFYQNISGTIQGGFVRSSLTRPIHVPANLTTSIREDKYIIKGFWRNITESVGDLSLQIFEEDKNASEDFTVREVSASMAVQTESSPGGGWEMKMFGVHYPKTGSVILTTTSEKFSGIFMLPYFALTKPGFEQSQELLNRSLSETLSHWEKGNADNLALPWIPSFSDESSTIFSVPSCEYVVYLQQRPVEFRNSRLSSPQVVRLIKDVEEELRFPKGAPITDPPSMVFNAIVFSPDCGFLLESTEDPDSRKSHFLSGTKMEAFWTLIRRLLLAFVIVLGLQISLLKRQMEEASTPSMRSRTSYYSIAMMAMGDGVLLASLIAFSMVNDVGFLILTSAGFLCLLNFAFFEMKFIYDIWLVQVGQYRRDNAARSGQRQNPEVQNTTSTGQPIDEGSVPISNQAALSSSGLPLPVTASRPFDTGATAIILPPDQNIEAAAAEEESQNAAGPNIRAGTGVDFQTLYSRFYFSLMVLVFISLWAFSWPKMLRSAYVNLLCFAYLSFWVPQIYRNVMRNCRQALTWEYVVGISILRLLPIIYCYTENSNPLRFETDPFAAVVLALWVSLQVLALATQQFLGPRLFVKESWCPPAYEYHPLLHDEVGDVESGSLLPIGFVASASEAKDKNDTKDKDSSTNLKIFDCAICMNEIEVPVVPSKETAERSNLGVNWLRRRTYMVTPCRHIFHSECLEGWMRHRLVCPICRESLPPL